MHAPWIRTAPHCSRMSFCKTCWVFFLQFNIYNSALYFYWQVCSILASSTLLLMTPPPPLLRCSPPVLAAPSCLWLGDSPPRECSTLVVFSLRMWRCSHRCHCGWLADWHVSLPHLWDVLLRPWAVKWKLVNVTKKTKTNFLYSSQVPLLWIQTY